MFEYWSALFPSMTMLAVMLVATALGATMRAFSGFGSGLLLAPVLSLYLSPQDMLAVVVLINLIGTLQMLPGVWKEIDWPLIRRMVPAALFGVPLGWMVLTGLDPAAVRRLVAGIVVVLSLVLLSGWVYAGARGRLQDMIAGVSSGTLTGIAGIGGPPFILYMMSAPGYSPAAFRTFFTVYFAFTQAMVLIVLLFTGGLGVRQLVYTGTLLPLYMLATALGTYLFTLALQHKAHVIKRISLLLLLAVGVIILLL
jgi:uncharacterized membrane protein YfcA